MWQLEDVVLVEEACQWGGNWGYKAKIVAEAGSLSLALALTLSRSRSSSLTLTCFEDVRVRHYYFLILLDRVPYIFALPFYKNHFAFLL